MQRCLASLSAVAVLLCAGPALAQLEGQGRERAQFPVLRSRIS